MMIKLLTALLLFSLTACQGESLSPRDQFDPSRFAGLWEMVVFVGDSMPVRYSDEQELHSRWLNIDPDRDSIPVFYTDSTKMFVFNEAQQEWGPDFTWSVGRAEFRIVFFQGDTLIAFSGGEPIIPFGLVLNSSWNELVATANNYPIVYRRR